MVSHLRDLNNVYSRVNISDFQEADCTHEKHLDSNCLAVHFSGGPELLDFYTIRAELDNTGVSFRLDANTDPAYVYSVEGQAVWGEDPEHNVFSMSLRKKSKGLRGAFGPASSPENNVLFNKKNDSALLFSGIEFPNLVFDFNQNCYTFRICLKGTGGRTFRIEIKENVYENKYALRYKPVNKNNIFPTPPAGWMTWYALMFNTSESLVLSNAAIQAEKLRSYGANVIWVDWEWYHNDFFSRETRCDTFHPDPLRYPNGLKSVADKIRELGLIPAIWIGATHEVRESDFIRTHPEAVLIEKTSWCGPYFFDPTNPAFLDDFIPKVFRQLMEWGYKAIKWDALPKTIDYIDQCHDELYDNTKTTEEALREVVKKARETVGEEMYMMSCHGEASRDITMYADLFDAARIGADILKWQEFIQYCVDRLYKYYPLHNVVQYLDPDNVVLREEFSNDAQAVSRATFVSLAGTPVNFGDDLTVLPDSRIEILRRILPVLDIHPMDIESALAEKEYAMVNLFIKTRYEEYQAVVILNPADHPMEATIRMSEMGMEEQTGYLVFDFWNKRFLGKLYQSVSLPLSACESRMLAFRRCLDHPQLVSTSRHITQGACEIRRLEWNENECTLRGVSSVVEGDEYIMYFYVPDQFSLCGNLLQRIQDNVYSMRIQKDKNEEVAWEILFTR